MHKLQSKVKPLKEGNYILSKNLILSEKWFMWLTPGAEPINKFWSKFSYSFVHGRLFQCTGHRWIRWQKYHSQNVV
jgi:hypothetical protein